MRVPAHIPVRTPPRSAPILVILGHARPGMVRCSRCGEPEGARGVVLSQAMILNPTKLTAPLHEPKLQEHYIS